MSLRGCLCRLLQHRPLTRSKMPSRLCLPGCWGDVVAGLPCLLWAASERPLGSSPLQIVAFAQEEQQQKTVQEKEEIKEVLRL